MTARATGLLASFSTAGVLAPADVHVAQRLGVLAGEADDRVLLAAALTVRGTRTGSVVLDLEQAAAAIVPDGDDVAESARPLPWPEVGEWVRACAASPLVTGAAGGPPLQMVGSHLWLDRYWRQEQRVADELRQRSLDRPDDIEPALLRADLDALFPDDSAADQRRAVGIAAASRLAVIAGGPGTGKTTTVAQLITVLYRRLGRDLRVALAAPTGKAAARLEEAVHAADGPLSADDRAALRRLSASTLHRLLGWRPGTSSRFRHDRDNHLPFDVVIVDESSMVSLTLMARLLDALGPATRLVLVGDPDQLASVEAGAVLGDLVDGLPLVERPGERRESVVRLRTVHRFAAGGPIAELASLVRTGRGEDALALLRSAPGGLIYHEVADDVPLPASVLAALQATVLAHEGRIIAAAQAGDLPAALDALDRHRVLCAHRGGSRGARHWSDQGERWLGPSVDARGDGRYAGQPLLVTANDYEVGLYNGDTGVVVQQGDELAAAFRRGGGPAVLPLVRLGDVRPLHAMTVHRAQGSQFDSVTVLLPFAGSPLATRQTLYTAVTRAASEVRLVGSAESVLTCAHRPIARATGLRTRLTGELVPVCPTGAGVPPALDRSVTDGT